MGSQLTVTIIEVSRSIVNIDKDTTPTISNSFIPEMYSSFSVEDLEVSSVDCT